MTRNQKMLKRFQEGKMYDYIRNHGFEFSKDELITIIQEYEYGIRKTNVTFDEDLGSIQNAIYEELAEYFEEEEEND